VACGLLKQYRLLAPKCYPMKSKALVAEIRPREAMRITMPPRQACTSIHPIMGDELRALRRLQREQEAKSPFVFTSERAGPVSTAGFARMMERPTRATTPAPCKPTSATGIFSTPSGTRSFRRPGSRILEKVGSGRASNWDGAACKLWDEKTLSELAIACPIYEAEVTAPADHARPETWVVQTVAYR
jgi:hypothetical protein